MANRRDLRIGITGDAGGFDKACQDAEDKARGLDRELAKLERQQAATEKVTTRTAAAVKQYGAEQDKAALAARRMGNEAEKAAKQAEQAQIRADAAANAYTRGLISEEAALRAAGRAEDAIERAAIKAAEAHRSAARAAEEQAQQERQLARDASLGAAAEELAVLKASGRVREHNDLLRSLEGQFGDLSKEGSGAFKTIETAGGEAFALLGDTGPVSIALIAAAIEALPTVAATAGGGIALGLGGALTAVALKVQASTADVRAAFEKLKSNVSADLATISAPFHGVILDMIADAQGAFDSLEPALQSAFAEMAPVVSRFAHAIANTATEFDPVIRSISVAFSRVLDDLGSQMGIVMGNLATGIKAVTDAVAANPQALANFVTGLSNVVRVAGDSIGFLIRYANQINTVFKFIDNAVLPLSSLTGLLFRNKNATDESRKAAVDFGNALGGLPPQMTPAQQAAQQLAKDMTTLSSNTASAKDRTDALSDALTRLLDPSLAAYEDTGKLSKGIADLAAALEKSHGKLGDNTEAALGAKNAFIALLRDAEAFAKDLFSSGDSLDQVQRKLSPYIASLYRAAGSNKTARAEVNAFVRALQAVPPAKGTRISVPGASSARNSINALQRSITNLHNKTVTVDYIERVHRTLQAERARAMGGYVGLAAGGEPQRRLLSGMVSGPGTSTSDSIPVRLSNGEFVINARATAANRPLLEAINSGRPVPVAAAVASGASGGAAGMPGSAGVPGFAAAVSELRAAAANLRNAQVVMDGKPVGQIVSRNLGQTTSLRRKTG